LVQIQYCVMYIWLFEVVILDNYKHRNQKKNCEKKIFYKKNVFVFFGSKLKKIIVNMIDWLIDWVYAVKNKKIKNKKTENEKFINKSEEGERGSPL